MSPKPRDVRERIRDAVEVDAATGCWLWTGVIQHSGYGQISVPRPGGGTTRTRFAHRVSYEAFIGPIPAGLVLDHVYERGCRSRHCVNPAHLEPVTQAENNRRSARLKNTLCPSGHTYDRRDSRGFRRCSRCHRVAVRRWRQKNKPHLAAYARGYRRRTTSAPRVAPGGRS